METTLNQPTDEVQPVLKRTARDYGVLGLKGFAMGSADVVPGVSGGTMAFILGIYEELINSIKMIGRPELWRAVLGLRIGQAVRILNVPFLLAVFAGIFLAIFTLAPGIEWTLEHQPIYIWSFFFGLVLASVFVVSRRITKWTALLIGALAAGTIFAFWLVGLVPVTTPNVWWFLILSGALASCAMILPGISGSFILVLLGKYEYVIGAVNDRDIVSILLIGIGAAVGLVTLAQLLSWLFKRYHDLTVAILIGFMVGSLRKVWPWKETLSTTIDRHGVEVPLIVKNVLPAVGTEMFIALAFALLGFAVVVLIERLAAD